MSLVAHKANHTMPSSESEKLSSFAHDLPVLRELKGYLLEIANSTGESARPTSALFYQSYQRLTLCTNTPDNRNLRIIVQDREALIRAQTLYFVGFFGHKNRK